jgi:hypothetical protein
MWLANGLESRITKRFDPLSPTPRLQTPSPALVLGQPGGLWCDWSIASVPCGECCPVDSPVWSLLFVLWENERNE